MSLRRKKPRPLEREEKPFRDARLFVIATEDTHAPKQYFRLFRSQRIKVRVLPTEGGLCAPEHVIERLDDAERERLAACRPEETRIIPSVPNVRHICGTVEIRKHRRGSNVH